MDKTTGDNLKWKKHTLQCFIFPCSKALWNSIIFGDDHRATVLCFLMIESVL
jgi:hypothetical protein